MNLDIRPAKTGKTTDLLTWMRERPQGRALVTYSAAQALQLFNSTLDDVGRSPFKRWQFVGADDRTALASLRSTPSMEVGIDELEMTLHGLLGHPVREVTVHAKRDAGVPA